MVVFNRLAFLQTHPNMRSVNSLDDLQKMLPGDSVGVCFDRVDVKNYVFAGHGFDPSLNGEGYFFLSMYESKREYALLQVCLEMRLEFNKGEVILPSLFTRGEIIQPGNKDYRIARAMLDFAGLWTPQSE